MCLVFVGWRRHPRYRLVVAANRDEYHARPTAPAAPWGDERAWAGAEGLAEEERPPEGVRPNEGAPAASVGRPAAAERAAGGAEEAAGSGGSTAGSMVERAPRSEAGGAAASRILAGRDLLAGGTWLGVTPEGRFAALTNFRGAPPPAPDAPSRGRLVVDYLRSGLGAREHAREVEREADRYSGFNLLLADRDELFCVTNRGGERMTEVPVGCHGLGNDRLNVPEPKVAGGLAEFRRCLDSDFEPEDLFALLADDEPAAEADLRAAGLERAHSARFIRGGGYGTRSSTVVLVDANGEVEFEERSFDARAVETGRVAFAGPAGAAGFAPGQASPEVRDAVAG